MSEKMKETGLLVLGLNKEALTDASLRVAGRVLVKKLVAIIKPKAPMMLRGYLDTPIGEAIVAQAAAFTLLNFTNNEKAAIASKALIAASAEMLLENFNVEGMLSDLLDGVALPTADAVVTKKGKGRQAAVTAEVVTQ